MKAHRKKKLITLVVVLTVLMTATLLIMYALRQNISLFYTLQQISQGDAPVNALVRVGGMVVDKSVKRSINSLDVKFKVTDYHSTVDVNYHGVLPTLFREGQGIVARGSLNKNGQFKADEILAKHDSNYMPPEVKASLKLKKKDI